MNVEISENVADSSGLAQCRHLKIYRASRNCVLHCKICPVVLFQCFDEKLRTEFIEIARKMCLHKEMEIVFRCGQTKSAGRNRIKFCFLAVNFTSFPFQTSQRMKPGPCSEKT